MQASKRDFLDAVKLDVIQTISEPSEKIIYQDIGYFNRIRKYIDKIAKNSGVDSNDDLEILHIASWLHNVGVQNAEVNIEKKDSAFSGLGTALSANIAFLEKINYPPEKIKEVAGILEKVAYALPSKPETLKEKIYADARVADFAHKNGKKFLKLAYEELLMRDVSLSKKGWYDMMISILSNHECFTEYGHKEIQPKVMKLIMTMQKEKKNIEKREDLVLKKELDISDDELKKLKKGLKSTKGRDERAIQTLFRTTSKNHYTLNEMVDRKASIMITVNSIILSVVVSGAILDDHHSITAIPPFILSIACFFSVVYAVLSIRPVGTHGEFTEEEIRSKQGNLLYFGNFHNMHQRDFEWGMLQMLNDSDYLYSSMMRDIYFLGTQLNAKYKFIRRSLNIFMIGLVLSLLAFIIVQVISGGHQ